MSANDLSQLDDVLALLTGDSSSSSSSSSSSNRSTSAKPLQPTDVSFTTSPAPTTTATPEEQQRQPRPTIAALDAYMSNLNSAFDSLGVGGGHSRPTDELSSSIFNLSSVVPKEREQSLLKLVNLSVEGKPNLKPPNVFHLILEKQQKARERKS